MNGLFNVIFFICLRISEKMEYKSKCRLELIERGTRSIQYINNTIQFKYKIGYCAIHKINNKIFLYIQNSTKMALNVIGRILRNVISFSVIESFDMIEGEVLEYIGSFKSKGEKHKDGISRRNMKKLKERDIRVSTPSISTYPPPSPDAPEQILLIGDQAYSCRLLDVHPLGSTFCAVYGSTNGLWEPRFWVGPVENIPEKDTCSVSPELKSMLMERQSNKCNECGCAVSLGSYSNSDVDHLVPRNLGGKTTLGNLQVICVPCHRTKTALEHRSLKRRFADIELPAEYPGSLFMVSNDLTFRFREERVEPVAFSKEPSGMTVMNH